MLKQQFSGHALKLQISTVTRCPREMAFLGKKTSSSLNLALELSDAFLGCLRRDPTDMTPRWTRGSGDTWSCCATQSSVQCSNFILAALCLASMLNELLLSSFQYFIGGYKTLQSLEYNFHFLSSQMQKVNFCHLKSHIYMLLLILIG